ncbi:zinc finger HIT domain-containing protein [Halobaculum sp. MBLA0143]
MNRAGLCQVCEASSARYACDACGAAVCDDHYEGTTGLCAECAGVSGGRR